MTPVERSWTNADGTVTKKWRIRFKDGQGKTKDRLFDTKREALSFVQNLSRMREAEKPVSAHVGLYEAVQRWIDQGRAGRDGKPPLEKKTLDEYGYLLTVLRRTGDDTSLHDATVVGFEALRDRLLQETVSRNNAIRVWNTLVRPTVVFARSKGWTHLELPKTLTIHRAIREDDPEDRYEVHTPEQMKALLGLAVEKMSHRRLDVSKSWRRFCPLIHLLVYSGMRSSELRGLPRSAVDFDAASIRIRQRADEEGVIGPPKSHHAYRTVIIPPPVMTFLRSWIDETESITESSLVFPSRRGAPLERKYLFNRMWKPLQEEAAVPVLNLHSTRHFFASRMISGGANPLELQKALGHHDPAFTMRVYGHLFGGEEAERRRRALAQALMV